MRLALTTCEHINRKSKTNIFTKPVPVFLVENSCTLNFRYSFQGLCCIICTELEFALQAKCMVSFIGLIQDFRLAYVRCVYVIQYLCGTRRGINVRNYFSMQRNIMNGWLQTNLICKRHSISETYEERDITGKPFRTYGEVHEMKVGHVKNSHSS